MIDLTLTEDELDLTSGIPAVGARLLPIQESIDSAVSMEPIPWSAERWQQLAELGWFSLGASEEQGGLGLRLVDEALMVMELGKLAAPGPLVGTLFATRLLSEHGPDGLPDGLLDAFMAGEVTAGVLVGSTANDVRVGDYVCDVGPERTRFARITEATAVAGVDESASTISITSSEHVLTVEKDLRPLLWIYLSAYLVGVAQAATDMAVSYAKVRQQFGAPIGSYQAVKHRCAEMAIRAHIARAQLLVAALLVADTGDGVLEAASAYFLATDAARLNVDDNVQNHGGIGYTAEHPAGVYVKRARTHIGFGGPQSSLVTTLLDGHRTTIT